MYGDQVGTAGDAQPALKANGVEPGNSDSAVQDLNDWFFAHVGADPEQPGWLLPDWYSVVHDVALFLGDLMIERHPNLRWEFFAWGKTNVSFQRHVIMGFSTEDPKFRTNINIDPVVATYAHEIIEHGGSIPSYGTVVVRGTPIDVDAAAERHRRRELEEPTRSCAGSRWPPGVPEQCLSVVRRSLAYRRTASQNPLAGYTKGFMDTKMTILR